MRTGNVYDLAAYRTAKAHQRTICQCCGDGPLLTIAEIEAGYEGGCIARHPEYTDLCEWCGRTVLEEEGNGRPNAPRRA